MSDPPATTEAYHSLNLRGVKTELYIALVIYGVLFGVCVFGLIRSLTKSFQYSWFKKLFFLFLATFVAGKQPLDQALTPRHTHIHSHTNTHTHTHTLSLSLSLALTLYSLSSTLAW